MTDYMARFQEFISIIREEAETNPVAVALALVATELMFIRDQLANFPRNQEY